jgi:hypothetical protein
MNNNTHAAFERLKLQEEILELCDWKYGMRNRKKFLRRRRWKDLRVQALLNSTLIEVDALLSGKLKLLHQYTQEDCSKWEVCNSGCNSVCSDEVSNQWDEKTCEDVNSLNKFMCLPNEVMNPVQR